MRSPYCRIRVEMALRYGEGVLIVNDGEKDQLFSQKFHAMNAESAMKNRAPELVFVQHTGGILSEV